MALSETIYSSCPYCDSYNIAYRKFCSNCGNSLQTVTPRIENSAQREPAPEPVPQSDLEALLCQAVLLDLKADTPRNSVKVGAVARRIRSLLPRRHVKA